MAHQRLSAKFEWSMWWCDAWRPASRWLSARDVDQQAWSFDWPTAARQAWLPLVGTATQTVLIGAPPQLRARTSGHDAHTQTHILSLDAITQAAQLGLGLHLDASTQAVPPSSSAQDASTQLSPSVLPRRRSCSKKRPGATASCSNTDGPSSPLRVPREVPALTCSARLLALSAHPPPSHLPTSSPPEAKPTRPPPTYNVSTALAGLHLPSSRGVQDKGSPPCKPSRHGTLPKADSDLMHQQYCLLVLHWNPGHGRKSPTHILAAAFGRSSVKPTIMLHVSRTSSLGTLAALTSPSCSTRTRSSLTLHSSPISGASSSKRHVGDGCPGCLWSAASPLTFRLSHGHVLRSPCRQQSGQKARRPNLSLAAPLRLHGTASSLSSLEVISTFVPSPRLVTCSQIRSLRRLATDSCDASVAWTIPVVNAQASSSCPSVHMNGGFVAVASSTTPILASDPVTRQLASLSSFSFAPTFQAPTASHEVPRLSNVAWNRLLASSSANASANSLRSKPPRIL